MARQPPPAGLRALAAAVERYGLPDIQRGALVTESWLQPQALDEWFRQQERLAAERREALLIEVARSYLPRPLRWAAERPSWLRVLYRVRPTWRPTVWFGVDGDTTVGTLRHADGTVLVLEPFQMEIITRYLREAA